MSQKSIRDVFSQEKFSIPKYQRDYAWKAKNFKELWEDLEEVIEANPQFKKGQGHFLGTIVVAPNQDDSYKFDIIDGQQRATTIFMLLYALISRIKLDYKYMILDKRGEIKLEVAPQNQEFFKKLLDEGKRHELSGALEKEADTEGKKNLYEVFKAILDKVNPLNEDAIETHINVLLHHMVLMWLEEPDAGRAIRTFQSVNDRGVPLKLLDKLKSLLIYYSNSYCNGKDGLDNEINNAFGEIFKIFSQISEHQYISNIGNQQFGEDDIFRYHAGSIKFKEIEFLGYYRNSNNNTYEKLKDELKALCKKSQDENSYKNLENFIRFYTSDLKKFYQAFLDLLNKIGTEESIFKLFMIEKINPYFYNSLVRLKINKELDDEIINLITKADILLFKSGSAKDGTAYNLWKNALKGKEIFKEDLIKECKNSQKAKDAMGLLMNNAYQCNFFHYVFFEKDCKSVAIDVLKSLVENKQITQEKEHIIPLKILDSNDETQAKKYGFNDLEDLRGLINSYGNLLSLEGSLNSKAQNGDLYEKKEVYDKSKLAFIRQFDAKNFNKSKILERNKEVEKWLREEFFKEFL